MPSKFLQLLLLVGTLYCLWSAYPSNAEDNENDPTLKDSVYYLEPITVTAEKREASLQATPLAISVYNEENLKDSVINYPTELFLVTPGVVIGNSANTSIPEIFVRGIGTTSIASGSDLPVGYYIDDIYVARGEGMFLNLFDIERIEILRGPQGILYGRNTPGGAIKIISKTPTNYFETAGKLALGNFDYYQISQMISGPLIKDKLLGRVSYNIVDREGFTDNLEKDSRLADEDNYHIKGSLWYMISEGADFLVTLETGKDRAAGLAYKPESVVPMFGGLFGNVTPENLGPGHDEPSDTFDVRHDTNSEENRRVNGITGKLTKEFDLFKLESITGYRKLEFDEITDVDGTSLQLFNTEFELSQDQYSQELRLSSKEDSILEWLLGAYLFMEDSATIVKTQHQDVAFLLGPGDYSGFNDVDVTVKSYALFGHGRYPILDNMNFTFGLRYSYEEKDFDIKRISNDVTGQIAPPGFNFNDSENWDAVTPKIGFEHQLSDDVMFFLSVSRGFKSGGYNSFQVAPEDAFDPEFLIAYESGVKSQWFDNRLLVNTSAFYYDYTDLQVQTQVPSSGGGLQIVTTNAAEAEVWGIEIEATGKPTHGLRIFGNMAFLSAEFDKFRNANGIDVAGNSLLLSPEFSSNLAIQYDISVSKDDILTFRVEHQYQGKIFFTETNESVLAQDGYHNINARIAFEKDAGRYTFSFFGHNLTDEETTSFAIDTRPFLGSVIRNYNPPRTFGGELSYKF